MWHGQQSPWRWQQAQQPLPEVRACACCMGLGCGCTPLTTAPVSWGKPNLLHSHGHLARLPVSTCAYPLVHAFCLPGSYWDLMNNPEQEQTIFGGRARSATDANVLRRKGEGGAREGGPCSQLAGEHTIFGGRARSAQLMPACCVARVGEGGPEGPCRSCRVRHRAVGKLISWTTEQTS